jgi:hypothetical protein
MLTPRSAGLETGPETGPDASPAPQPPATGQDGQGTPPGVYPPPPGAYTPPPTALTVIEPPQRGLTPQSRPDGQRDRYEPDIKPPSPVWQAIKWPLRKALLGIYIGAQAARRHKIVALVVSALLVALIATALIVRQLTLPGPPALGIEKPASLPAIPTSVLHYLHGQETYNAQEMWNSLDSSARSQSGASESQLQSTLDQERSQGIQITRLVYSGGYQTPDGSSHYTFEVYATKSGQTGTFTWYFVVGSNGLITAIQSL